MSGLERTVARPEARRRGGVVPEADGEALVSLCAFDVGAEGYALDLRRIREILRPLRITSVPRAPPFLEGVVQLRDAVIPVVDLRKRLGAPVVDGPGRRLLLALVGRRPVALVVDRVAGVLRLPRSSLRPAPVLWGGGASCFLGACEDGERLRLLLDLKALLRSDEPISPPVGPAGSQKGAGGALRR